MLIKVHLVNPCWALLANNMDVNRNIWVVQGALL